MAHYFKTLGIETKKQFELLDVTEMARAAVRESGVQSGLCCLFCPHTTAGVRLNHAEPLLMQDIMKALYRLAPMDISYSHDLFELRQNAAPNERSNGHAHVKSFLLGSSETIPVKDGALQLGKQQSVFFVELDGGRPRSLNLAVIGE